MTLNSSVVVHVGGMTIELRGHACAFGRVDEAVSGGKPPAGNGVVVLLS